MNDKNSLKIHFLIQGKKDAICGNKAYKIIITTVQHHPLCRKRISQLVNLKINKM
jgi:hypothetical protein